MTNARCALALLFLTVVTALALAEPVPRTFTYQGYLKNGAGVPLTGATNITFSLYSSNPARNNPVWQETRNVTPLNGIYSIRLGEDTPLGVPFDVGYRLGVKVGNDPEMPLQLLSSVPYALNAREAGSVAASSITTDKLVDGSVTSAKVAAPLALSYPGGKTPTISGTSDDYIGLMGFSNSYMGIHGYSKYGTGVDALTDSDKAPAIAARNNYKGPIFIGYRGNDNVFSVGNDGSVTTAGNVTATGAVTAGRVTTTGNINLPATTASSGIITSEGGVRLIHAYGATNFFAGLNAGNLTMTGGENTGIGRAALYYNATGTQNTATGYYAMLNNNSGSSNTANGYQALKNNATGTSNTGIGAQAMSSNSSGSNNTAIGVRALENNTTAGGNTAVGFETLKAQWWDNSGSGWESFNTAIGYRSLSSNLVGKGNTATGVETLTANLTGDENTAAGYRALKANTYGFYNTGTGSYALTGNITGYNNVATGYRTLSANTAGHSNTASGADAMYGNTTASGNTAVGYKALESQSFSNNGSPWEAHNTALGYMALSKNSPDSIYNGYLNTAVGSKALTACTTGSYNTATGYMALFNDTTGGFNTAYGEEALFRNTTGAYNTAVGQGAFFSNTTGSYNTAVGHGANMIGGIFSNATVIGARATVNADNKVRIGDNFVTVIEGQVAWSNPSDIRLKKDVADVTHGLDFIRRLRPVEFRMTQGNGRKDFGFIAQEIEAVLGTDYNVLGIGGDEKRTLTLRYTDFIAPLVKAVQEQQGVIERQGTAIEELRAQVAELKRMLNGR